LREGFASSLLVVALAAAISGCQQAEAPMHARNDTATDLIVRLVVTPPDDSSAEPRFFDYVVPASSTRALPAPNRAPGQAVLYDAGCTFLSVAFFTDQQGASFAAGGQLYRNADLTSGFTKDRLAGQFPDADRDARCAGVPFDPSDF
jgi:hypothetical protein